MKFNLKQLYQQKRRIMQHWQVISIYLAVFDAFTANFAYFLGLWLRFDCMYSAIPKGLLETYGRFAPFYTMLCVFIFWRFRLYNSIWRFASYNELLRATAATVLCGVLHMIGSTAVCVMVTEGAYNRMPVVYYFTGFIMQLMFVVGIRFSYRFFRLMKHSIHHRAINEPKGRVMLIGAGAAGQMILRDIVNAKETRERVCCIIDDNPNKWGRYIDGVEVVGGKDSIMENVSKYQINKIYLALPSATPEQKRDILNICKETGCELKNLPGVYQLVNGEVSVSAMKNVAIQAGIYRASAGRKAL